MRRSIMSPPMPCGSYFEALDGAPSLTGRTPREKGSIHRAELEPLDAISAYFHNATPGLGPDVEIYQSAEWGCRQRDKALKGIHYFDGILKSHSSPARRSMADITIIGSLIFAGLVELPVPAECEALRAWYATMRSAPASGTG